MLRNQSRCRSASAGLASLSLMLFSLTPAIGQTRPSPGGPPQSSIRQGFLDLPGVRLFYRDSGGTGVPVVFLHAATADSRGWEHQIPIFTSAGYRFIAFDRRGSGQSVIDDRGPQPGSSADDLRALMDHLKIDRFHVVGTGAGGFVALDVALSFPTRLRSVVVACAQGGVQDQEFQDVVARLRSPEFNKLSVDFHELSPSYRAANPEGVRRWLEFERASRVSGRRSGYPPMRSRITYALLETIATPLLFVAGGADLYAPPALMRLVAARVKGSEFVVVPEAGHSAYWEEPEAFNAEVLRFIRRR